MSKVRQNGSFLFSHCFVNCKQNLEHSHAAASSLTANQTPNLYSSIYKGRKNFVCKNSRKCQTGLSFTCTASPVHFINSNDWSIKSLLSSEEAPDAPLWLPQAGFWQQSCVFCRSRRKAPGRGQRGPEPLFICSTWSFEGFVQTHPATAYRPPAHHPLNSEPLLYICSQHLPRKPCCSFLLPWHEFSVIYPISPLSDFVLEIPSPIQLSICTHTYKNIHTHKHTAHPISSPYSLSLLLLINILFFTYLSPVSPSTILASDFNIVYSWD